MKEEYRNQNSIEGQEPELMTKEELMQEILDQEQALSDAQNRLFNVKVEIEKLESQGVNENNDDKGEYYMANDRQERVLQAISDHKAIIENLNNKIISKDFIDHSSEDQKTA